MIGAAKTFGIIALAIIMTITATTTASYAQEEGQPATLAELTTPHIGPGGEFVPPIVAQLNQECKSPSIPAVCIELVYASGSIVVLKGGVLPELQVNRNFDNDFIWQAVEQVKAQGYTIQSVSIIGSGTEANPGLFYVVLTK